MTNLVTLRPKPGDVVERVYHVECELGSDATSAVLGAVVPATGKRYALRCWLDGSGADAAITTQQFVRIANSIRLFEQPGIVEVYGVGRTNGLFYSVTEWLEGTTLERFLERNGPLSTRDALNVILPCLEGLAAAHSGGISHGDLRPANVFVCRPTRTEPERARLGKFGYGSWPDKAQNLKRPISSDVYHRQFVSPEELQGATANPRSDVYAVGVLLYVMLAGRSPFKADNSRQLDREILTGNWKPLSERLPKLARGFDDLIARAMTRDPEDRFRDMSAMLTELARVEGHSHNGLAKHAPLATTYKWITPTSKWIDSPIFDLPPSVFEAVEQRRNTASGRVLRACLVLALGLLSATMLRRAVLQPEVPLLSAKQRQLILSRPIADDTSAALSFDPMPVPAAPTAAADDQKTPTSVRPSTSRAAAPLARKPALTRTEMPPAPENRAQPQAAMQEPQPPAAQPSKPSRLLPFRTTASPSSAPLSTQHVEALDHLQLQ